MAGAQFERQEIGLINAVNSGYGGNNGTPFTLIGVNGISIQNCISAEKYEGRSTAGTEPYTDVIINVSGNKSINISNKGDSAPSIAGGGIEGLETAVPGLTKKFLESALSEYKKRGFIEGMSNVPDMYGKVSNNLKEKIVVGNVSMGGPIHYMYIGPMDVTFNQYGSNVKVNGKLFEAKKYAKDNDLYLRLRKRRADQPLVLNEKDSKGLPLILGRSPSRGDKGRRIVTVKKPPLNAIVVDI
tara:strand:+ start:9650 stop:10375 length:726 start_codon:yes stop_codon:yes gene_type:complete